MSSFAEILSQVVASASTHNEPEKTILPQSDLGATKSSVRDLNEQVERLSLATEAMWRLLSEHLGFTDEHLKAIILALDESDGTRDGVYRPEPGQCSCGAKVNAAADICQFCGAGANRRKIF